VVAREHRTGNGVLRGAGARRSRSVVPAGVVDGDVDLAGLDRSAALVVSCSQVMSASVKPRLAGRQPSSSWGAPGDDLTWCSGTGKDAVPPGPDADASTIEERTQ